MVALRGFGWPHIESINRSNPQSIPSSPVVSPNSSEDLIKKAEVASQDRRQFPSEEDCRREPTFRSFSPVCSGLHSQSSSLFKVPEAWWVAQEKSVRSCSPFWEGLNEDCYQKVAHPCVISHDLFDFSWGIENPLVPLLDLNLRANSIALALDSAIDGFRIVSPRACSPFEEHGGDGSHQSYSTSVRELIQEEPDFPIGGIEAAPMAPRKSPNIGTLAIQGTDEKFMEATPPELPECCEEDVKPKRTKIYSTSSEEIPGTENRPMVTAPETPHRPQRSDRSTDRETDRSSGDDGHKKQRRKGKKSRTSDRSDNSNRSQTSEIPGTRIRDFAIPMSSSGISPLSKSAKAVRISEVSNRKPLPKAPKAPEMPMKSALAKVPNGSNIVTLPALDMAVPMDVSGQLPTPQIPGQAIKTRKRVVDKGRKVIRRGRAKVIRKPVMVMIVGKQLAGPTCAALKLLAEGKPIDPKAVTGVAAGTVSGVSPVGAPPIPA